MNSETHAKMVNNSKADSCHQDNKFSPDGSQDDTIRQDTESPRACQTHDDTTRFGIGMFKPQWLQKFATPRYYLALYCAIGILQSMNHSYFSGCISTLEKRFAFKSQITGYIILSSELFPLALGIPISYFGSRLHKPRIVASGILLVVAACYMNVLPFLIYGPAERSYEVISSNNTGPEVCDHQSKAEMCDDDDRPPTVSAAVLLGLASIIDGCGWLTYYTVGLAYMDDNTHKRNTPVYMAIYLSLRTFGPILGFLMSSAFLKLNENPFSSPDYGPEDPRWIGGWWMGFVLTGSAMLLLVLPLAMFPKHMPGKRSLQGKPVPVKDETVSQMLYGLIPTLRRLSRNPIFLLLTLNSLMGVLDLTAHYMMLPKFMENQFGLSASDASLYSGPPSLAVSQITVLAGGFIMWKYRPSARLLAVGLGLSEAVSAIGYIVLMLPRCQTVNLSNAGLTTDGLNILNDCNTKCSCTTASFTPICGPDKMTMYFSPCHAGCTEAQEQNKTQTFKNCSCITDDSENFFTANSLTEGICVDENCWTQALTYITLRPVFYGLSSILRVSHMIVFLRSIDPGDKSVALGTFETLLTICGFIPYPIVVGALLDYACLVFETSCGQTGNCWFYDMNKFNHILHGMSAMFTAISALCLFGVSLLSSRMRDLYKDEEETSEVTNQTDGFRRQSFKLSFR